MPHSAATAACSARVEAVVDGDVAGEGVVDPLLRLDRDHLAPAVHAFRPFDRVHADIGAATERDDAVAEVLAPQAEQRQRHLDLGGIERRGLEDLETDADAVVLVHHPVVEAVDDHAAVVRCSEDEGDLALGIGHADGISPAPDGRPLAIRGDGHNSR